MNTAVAYGSVYIDQLEDVESLVEKQVLAFKESKIPIEWYFFDIVCNKDQSSAARAARGYVAQELAAAFCRGDIYDFMLHCYVAIAYDERHRPAQEAMQLFVDRKDDGR